MLSRYNAYRSDWTALVKEWMCTRSRRISNSMFTYGWAKSEPMNIIRGNSNLRDVLRFLNFVTKKWSNPACEPHFDIGWASSTNERQCDNWQMTVLTCYFHMVTWVVTLSIFDSNELVSLNFKNQSWVDSCREIVPDVYHMICNCIDQIEID